MKEESEQVQKEKILVHVDPDLMDLIPEYLENMKGNIRSILNALEKGDYETIRILGHSMKGSGGGYGFDPITQIGRFIEEAAKDTNPAGIRQGVSDLASYLKRVEVVYD
jgi:hypothetical protein